MRLRQLLFSATVSSALMFTSSSNAERDRNSCDTNPRGAVDFADAAFNTVGADGARVLGGNAFAIYAEPTTEVKYEGANRKRVWTAIMVTAAHVIENVCSGYTPVDGDRVEGVRANTAWRLTLAPNPGSDTDSFGNRLQPVEATLTADICQSQIARPTNPDLVPDLVLFQQKFELPLSVVMRPYVVGYPTASTPGGDGQRAPVNIRGFRPSVFDGTLPVYNLAGLRWGLQEGTLQTVGYSRNSNWRRVVTAQVFTNQSGSPIVSAAEPYLVYGVLTHQGIRPGCSGLLARIAGLPQSGGLPQTGAQNGSQMDEAATGAQRGQNERVSEDACRYNQDATNAAQVHDNTAGAAVLVDFLANYNDRFAGIVERQNAGPLEQQSVARIRAAVTLYELYAAEQDNRRLQRALRAALERLTAIEQVRFMSMVSGPTRQALSVMDDWMCIGRGAQDIGEQ